MIENYIYQHLCTSATITNQVGVSPCRLYPVRAPQNPTYPFIVYQRVGTNPEYTVGGFANLSNVTIQFDAYATSHSAIRALSSAIHTVMQTATFPAILENDMDFPEPEVDAYRVTQDYSIWIQE